MSFSDLTPDPPTSADPIAARVSVSVFRRELSRHLALVQRGPVVVTSRDAGRRAILVSPEYFDRVQVALQHREGALARARTRGRDPEAAEIQADEDFALLIDEIVTRQREERRRIFG